MQPPAQGVAGADRARLAGEHQEGGLEGVFDVVLVLEDGPAGGQDHRPVPRHQGLEGRLVARLGVSGQELAVAEADGRPVVEQVAEVPQGPPHCAACHECQSSPDRRPPRARFFVSCPSQYRIRETGRREPPDFLEKMGDYVQLREGAANNRGRTTNRTSARGIPYSSAYFCRRESIKGRWLGLEPVTCSIKVAGR